MEINVKLKLAIGFAVIIAGIFIWLTVGLVEVNKMPTNYSLFLIHEGEDKILESDDGKLFTSFTTHENFLKVTNIEGNTLEIESKYIGRNLDNGEIIFNATNIFYVDRTTRQHVQNYSGYFDFPNNVQKQDYEFFHPIVLGQTTFVFEGEEVINNLKVYIFSCKTLENDLTYAYTQFDFKEIWYDGKCKIWIEPDTGKIVDFELEWDIYFVENGVRTGQVEKGGMNIIDDVKFGLVQNALTSKNLHFNNNVIFPLLFVIISSSILLGVIAINEKTKTSIQYKQTKKADRLIAIGELSANIAHDIRNPLSAIQMSNTIIKEMIHDEKGLNEIMRIDRSIARINHQLEQVLEFVRKSPLKLEKSSLIHVLEETIKTMEIPPNISINMSQDDFEVLIDCLKMENVFYNIIFNAIQSIENQKGTITIRISEEGDMIKMEFEDDGPNIPDEVLPKIFDPLFSTKQQGTGLGLSAAKNSVEQHGGTISVTNNPVVFTVKFLNRKKIDRMDQSNDVK